MERLQALEAAKQIVLTARIAVSDTNQAAWEFLRRVTARLDAEQRTAFDAHFADA